MPRAWEIGYTQPCIKCREKSVTHFVYFWSRKTLPYTHLEATSYIPQEGQSLHIWTTSLSTTGCYKNKYTIQFLWMACIRRFATAILSGETELALGTIRVKVCSGAKERVGYGKQREITAPAFSLGKLQHWLLSLRWKTCLWAELRHWYLSLQWKTCPWAEHSDNDDYLY